MTEDARGAGERAPLRLRRFLNDTSGAVTVDWIVLTAAIIGTCIAIFASIQSGAVGMGDSVRAALDAAGVVELGDFGRDD
ncbi:Flp family type IVb pilin [Rhodovulum sulfidophilum]|uniref:Flp family type IVb pilin n=1 Tax=Rhodovulum sulfidophilum TaxID=35806 RepID=UPI001F36012E|nr:hypothetical protein [Rhodovulum sulfidophilum]MCE8440683.1 hypothetical protein [Rhodovulum sulfidophilum]MCE8469924.1 hypothetical protein [Rhodovulum sulfidophilum]